MQNGRPFDHFLTELKQKARTCEFENICDSLIRDRIVIGIDSKSTRERLLREPDLTLEKSSILCRAAEQCKQQSKTFFDDSNPACHETKIDGIRKKQFPKNNKGYDTNKSFNRK